MSTPVKYADYESLHKGNQASGDARDAFPFGIDGAVIKLNSLKERIRLGSTRKRRDGRLPINIRPRKKRRY
jgi:NAD-dependent DNA ligase